MLYYLSYRDGTYSQSGDYAEKPQNVDGADWVQGEPTGLRLRGVMPYYLLHEDGTYSDAGVYPVEPEAIANKTWVRGKPEKIQQKDFRDINEKLEDEFLTLLPNHKSKPYLTNKVIDEIIKTKRAVEDANKIDPSGEFAIGIIQNLTLPSQMQADKAKILAKLGVPNV